MVQPANRRLVTEAVTTGAGRLSEASIAATIDSAIAATDLTGVAISGDSLVANWAANTLALADAIDQSVVARGNGGHRSYWIAARQGGQPMLATVTSNTIPATGPIAVTLAYYSPAYVDALMPNTTLAVVIAGVAGSLVITGEGTGTFTRTTAGKAVTVPPGISVITGLDIRDRWPIFWAGRNNFKRTNDAAQIVRDLLAMARWTNRADRLLVLGIPPFAGEEVGQTAGTTGANNRLALDAANLAIKNAFPTQFVDVPFMLRSVAAIESVSLTPTAQDLTDMGNGLTPTVFRTSSSGTVDSGHLGPVGYDALNKVIVAEYAARGWIEIAGVVPPVEPEIPELPPLHNNGVPGAIHRYVAERVVGSPGAAVTLLPDAIGGIDLTPQGTSNLVLAEEYGDRFIRLPALAPNTATSGNLAAAKTLDTPFTFAAVVRVSGGTSPSSSEFVTVDGYQFGRAANGSWQLQGAGTQTKAGSADWALVFAVANAAASLLAVNGDPSTGSSTITGKSATTSKLNIVRIGAVGGQSAPDRDIKELTIWPFALTEEQRDAHYAAMKAKYPVIP